MQFEIHHNGRNSELDGVAEGLEEEELPRRSTESEEEADSEAEEKADSEAEDMANSEAEEKADSGAEEDADSESHHEHDDPLYAGAAITVGVVAMTLLLVFIIRHKLTNEAITDLLYLIDHLCPKPNRCCKTLYKFKKFFSFLILPFNCYYYCAQCINPIFEWLRSCNGRLLFVII